MELTDQPNNISAEPAQDRGFSGPACPALSGPDEGPHEWICLGDSSDGMATAWKCMYCGKETLD